MRARRAVMAMAAPVAVVAVALLVAPGLAQPTFESTPAAVRGQECREGPVVVGWVVDPVQPWLTTGVRVSGLSDTCRHNRIMLEVRDEHGTTLTELRESLRVSGQQVVLDFDAPIHAAPVGEVRVVLSGAERA